MPAPSQSASFSNIINAIATQVVTVTALSEDYVNIVASDKYNIADYEAQFIYIRFYGLQPWTDYGAGRRVRRAKRFVRVYIYTRNNLDRYGDDTAAATAHSDLEETLMNALDEFIPRDALGNPLVVEPLHPLDDTAGPERKPIDDDGLISSSLLFEVEYVLPNNTPQP